MPNVFPTSALAFDTLILSWCIALSLSLLQPPGLLAAVLPVCKVRLTDQPFQPGVPVRSGERERFSLAATSPSPRSIFPPAVANGKSMFSVSITRFRVSRGG
jgi:hypothetical protein